MLELPPAPGEVGDAVEGAGVAAVWRVLEVGRVRAGEGEEGLTFFDCLVHCWHWGVRVCPADFFCMAWVAEEGRGEAEDLDGVEQA